MNTHCRVVGGAFALVMLNACAIQRAEVAHNAQVQMVGLSKEKVLACMGAPLNKATEGQTEVWSYVSGNGRVQSSAVVTGDANYTVTGVAVATQRYCNIDVVMTNGVVSRVNYIGPTGGVLTAGEQCAYAVQNCAQP
jgi:outer membrane protein assembly factor BamE (lipoprotein component of BamABCDE complex)